ncbi:hypothetical protein AXG93_3559s1200 [Marchantia polymorpha subsp. ruderalis]|uniref:Uncharacterized protein n=1 Tax=Marchantia polymorpha subsp. ruderalis TaxID=1480154 RepID=A0A176WNI6_MARPO|nr:hypothetical protein AXG93_3559s1200 [Marchantia polymorpha subsp. ruderalis]
MAARIEQLEQRLAAMAMTRGAARAPEPRGATGELDPERGEGGRQARLPQSFLLLEVSKISSMRHVPPSDLSGRTKTSTSRVVDMDTPSSAVTRMRHVPPSDLSGRTKTSTSRVVDMDTPSSAVTRMASKVMRSPLFSATELIDSGIDLARVFRLAATLCERESVTTTNAEVGEAIVEELSSSTTLSDEST